MNKSCQNCKASFVIEADDLAFYQKIKVPPPTFCPICRAQRRLAFRNEHFLYKRKSDFSGKEIFSMYPPESYVKVYENNNWFSDKWDPLEYGEEVDFSRPFLGQLFDLMKRVPVFAMSTLYGVNSDYSNNFTGYKNCYLVFNGNYSEDCMYGLGMSHSKNCVDSSYVIRCENCYGNFWLNESSNIFFSSNCVGSYNLYFCKNCHGCNDCFSSANLRNKRYHIFNQPYSKEEYFEKLKQWDLGSFTTVTNLKKEAREFWARFPVKYMEGLKNLNVSGDYIYNSKNVHNSYILYGAENSRFLQLMELGPIKDCYDYSVWGNNAELVYETCNSGIGLHNVRFCLECWPEVDDLQYSFYCGSSSKLFGCVGLRHKEHCILNKQYPKEEYEKLVPKIIEHMDKMPYTDKKGITYRYGEYLPIEFSPLPYNQTSAYDHFPLSRDEVMAAGYFWVDFEERAYSPTVSAKDLPDNIRDVQDSVTNEVILCSAWAENPESALAHNCTKVFRILPQELVFYRRFNLPLPRLCPYSRHAERITQRNPMKLWPRKCQCNGEESEKRKEEGGEYQYKNAVKHLHGSNHCPNEFETSYAPNRLEVVYCEACYNAEVV